MDKSWVHESRLSPAFEGGVTRFLDLAFANTSSREIRCPCNNCHNTYYRSRDVVYEHLICNGTQICHLRLTWRLHRELMLYRYSNEALDGDRHGQNRAERIACDQKSSAVEQELRKLRQRLETVARKLESHLSSVQGSDPNKTQPPHDSQC